MNCNLCRRLLNQYGEGTLSPSVESRVDQHLDSCPECTARLCAGRGPKTGPLNSTSNLPAPALLLAGSHAAAAPSILSLFDEPTVWENILRVLRGLRQPPGSGEHKWARLQMLRLTSPLSGMFVPTLVLFLTAFLAGITPERETRSVAVRPEDPPVEPLKETRIDVPPPDIKMPEFNSDVMAETESAASPGNDATAPEQEKFNPQIGAGEGVPRINSPVTFVGMPERANPGSRRRAVGQNHVNYDDHEWTILRSLRWLKKNQEPDGSWKGTSGGGRGPEGIESALTGMALLAYLGHGETPGDSPEFGSTVEKAIKWLLRKQESGGFPRPYQQAIATYALSEAYAMTRIPSLGKAARRGTDILIAGQNPSGGFDYGLNNTMRDDTSVMGWCAQALKAAKIARVDSPGLDAAMKKAVDGFRKNFQGNSSDGGFGYTGPDKSGLTGAGALCMQLLGQGDGPEVKGALAHLVATDRFAWAGVEWRKIYYWYYNTQARFYEGGECWKSWNRQFSVPLMNAQQRIEKAIEGPDGKPCDIGYWDANNDRGGRVMDTALCTLTLEVYYRYLGTYKSEAQIAAMPELKTEGKDIFIEILPR